jgi:hypothetical protein
MPVDVNRAGYVRHTGLTGGQRKLPRALLPLKADEKGTIPIASLRDPGAGSPLLVWIDLHVPADAAPGPYAAACELVDGGGKRLVGAIPVQLNVYNFTLPDERHLQLVGSLGWDALTRLYPDRFEAVRPRLFNRKESRYAAAIHTLDGLVALGQRHRASVVVPRLQPTVKWPANEPPQVDWSDFDSVVAPWLNGDGFADHTPLGYWPLPAPEFLETVDPNSQLQYWTRAARHFDQNNGLDRAAVRVEQAAPIPGRPGAGQAVELSAWAAQLLAQHPRLRVMLPLEQDQLQFAGPDQPGLLDPATAGRIWAAAPGLVFAPPMKAPPAGADVPDLWLRTDVK